MFLTICKVWILLYCHSIKEKAVKDLKRGQGASLENVSSEYYKYSCDNWFVLLSLVFNFMIANRYPSSRFMETLIIPIVKDKKGDITDGDNYWPFSIHLLPPNLWNLFWINS